MIDPRPKSLADALMKLLKSRGVTDEAALTILGQVIVESPAYRGKWSAPAPPVSDEARRQLAERIRTSEHLRKALRELGYDPDELTEDVRQRSSEVERSKS